MFIKSDFSCACMMRVRTPGPPETGRRALLIGYYFLNLCTQCPVSVSFRKHRAIAASDLYNGAETSRVQDARRQGVHEQGGMERLHDGHLLQL